MITCAACSRPIPEQYERSAPLTAAGPMHPGCYRKATGQYKRGQWDTRTTRVVRGEWDK